MMQKTVYHADPMRRRITPLALIGCIALAGCTSRPNSIGVDRLLRNPLFAERYAENVVDRLVELEIIKDPSLEDETAKVFLEEQRKHWLEVARDARAKQRKGSEGNFIPIGEYAKGDVLSVDHQLHFGTLFEIDPLPSLHVYLTTVVDPRDVRFPDETALDLGPLQTPYGAQTYAVPQVDNPLLYRTAVLWDKNLGRLHSFAQLSK